MSASASTSTTTHPDPLPSSSSQTSALSPSTSPTLPHSPETQRQIAEARRALEASMTNIGTSLSTSLQSRAQNLHSNSKQLEKQQKEVVKATEGLRKENEKLKKVVDEGSRKVKELGNVQNWAEMLERDFLVLQETVRLANVGSGESDWESGSYSGSEWSGSEDGDGDGDKEEGVDGHKIQGAVDLAPADVVGARPEEVVDNEGDTQMKDIVPEADVKGKGKELVTDPIATIPEMQSTTQEGSIPEKTGSTTDASSVSVHTSASNVS